MIQISKSEGKGSHLFCNKRLNFVLLGGILLVKYSLKARWRMLIFGKIIRSIQKTDREGHVVLVQKKTLLIGKN
jgi:hypothetical protein